MQYTTNFNFNLPEGTDLWNYLTQTNPNFTALDSILKGVQDGTVTTATEVTSGTAHAITRTLPDANVIRYTATGVWTLGDTMTIDGTPVTVVKPNGTSLQTGDYIIGSEVLGVLRATQFTVYVGGASSVDAADVTFDNDNTHTWLTATDVEDALKETATEVDTINSNLLHTEAGASVDLHPYNNSLYECTDDGYINVYTVNNVVGDWGTVFIYDSTGLNNLTTVTGQTTSIGGLANCLYVKKGLKLKLLTSANAANIIATFTPLVS